MTPVKAARIVTWIGLAGYAFSAPASIAISQLFLGLGVLGFIIYLIVLPERRDIVFPPWSIIVVMILYTLLRLLSAVIAGATPWGVREDWLFLLVIVGAVMFRDIKNLTRVLDCFAAGIAVMGIYGIWQHFVGIDFYHGVLLDRMTFGYRAIGNFSTYLTFSGLFALATIFLVPAAFTTAAGKRRIGYLIASQIALACILFNYSRSSILALVVGIIALVLLISARYRKWVIMVLLLTLAIGMVISTDFLHRFKNLGATEFNVRYANSRLAIWQATLGMIADNPVTGVGPGTFHTEYIQHRQNRTGKDLSHAHNDILNVAAESGIPCAVLFLLLWFLMFYHLYRGYRRCPEGFQRGLILGSLLASIVFLLMAQFEAFFSDEEVRMLLMFIWGIGLAVLGNLKASERLSEIA